MLDTRDARDPRTVKHEEMAAAAAVLSGDATADLSECVSEAYDAIAELSEMVAEIIGGGE